MWGRTGANHRVAHLHPIESVPNVVSGRVACQLNSRAQSLVER